MEKDHSPRVLFDYQTFHIQRFGGISRYFCEIIARMGGVKSKVAIGFSMNKYLSSLPDVRFTSVPKRPFKILEGVFRTLNRRKSLKALKRGDYDIFHPTYYDPYFLPALVGKPFVLTIHDMTHERYPQFFSPKDPTPVHKRLLAEKATRIIAISECTKRDIIEFLGVDEEKIDVIYHGLTPSSPTECAGETTVELPDNYILYVGERRGYKNFDRTVEAFCKVIEKHPQLHLVFTGRPLSKSEQERFTALHIIDRVRVMSDISDATLALLYHRARLFVYPSLYEGFGIPILEAFSQRCPVVLSKASCFPEVAGSSAEYFSPESTEELCQAMLNVLDDEARRNELIESGLERLKHFTWDETARQTQDCYLKALS